MVRHEICNSVMLFFCMEVLDAKCLQLNLGPYDWHLPYQITLHYFGSTRLRTAEAWWQQLSVFCIWLNKLGLADLVAPVVKCNGIGITPLTVIKRLQPEWSYQLIVPLDDFSNNRILLHCTIISGWHLPQIPCPITKTVQKLVAEASHSQNQIICCLYNFTYLIWLLNAVCEPLVHVWSWYLLWHHSIF